MLLCEEPILQFPDFETDFILTTDASEYAIAGVLSQGTLGQDLPISYTTRVLNAAEKNYSTIEKEFLAIIYCVSHFRPYLYGRKFTLVTDHRPLTWIHRVKDPTSRLMKWRLNLEEYDYTVIFKSGTTNKNADALSRIFKRLCFTTSPKKPRKTMNLLLKYLPIKLYTKNLQSYMKPMTPPKNFSLFRIK